MKKLAMALEDLTVETFVTEEVKDTRGTVEGQALVSGNYPTCTTCYMTKINTCCTPVF